MELHNLEAPKENKKKKKRLGRGIGSGHGGHTVGKGHNGQRARSGFSLHPAFEGGQMPLFRRLPKFGFKNPFRESYVPLNLDTLQGFVNSGKLDNEISFQDLVDAGIVHKKNKVKLLGTGNVETAITIEVHKSSKSAKAKLEDAGGTLHLIDQ